MSARDPASLRGSARDAFANERTAALPFLPTLFTAIVIAALSLLCRPSAEPTAVAATALQPGADGFHGATVSAGPTPSVPAVIAFGQFYPLTPGGMRVATVAPRSVAAAARAASAARRGCGSGRCLEAKRVEPLRSAVNPPRPQVDPVATSAIPSLFRPEADQGDDVTPEDALPFVPTAASAVDTVRSLGDGAVSLGTSVLGSLALPR